MERHICRRPDIRPHHPTRQITITEKRTTTRPKDWRTNTVPRPTTTMIQDRCREDTATSHWDGSSTTHRHCAHSLTQHGAGALYAFLTCRALAATAFKVIQTVNQWRKPIRTP